MLNYYLKCKGKTDSKNPKVVNTVGRIMVISNCVVCNNKNQDLANNQKLLDY